MIYSYKHTKIKLITFMRGTWQVGLVFVMLTALGVLTLNKVGQAAESRLIQIYVDGEDRIIATNAGSVGEVLKENDIELGPLDLVEPSSNTRVEGEAFQVNVFRASPFMVVDQGKHFVINSPHSSPLLVAKSAGLDVYPEDKITVELVEDFVADQFIGKKLIIERATPVSIEIDGHVFQIRTHAKTVSEVLEETGIELIGEDFTTISPDTKLKAGQHIGVVRVGHELVTEEEILPFATRVISDHTMPFGERKIIQEGVEGRKLYTYEVKRHDGVEVDRQLVSTTEFNDPIVQVVVRGTAIPDVYTTNDQILAALRECETHNNYQANTGNGFYGAYQFMDSTWDRLNTGYERADFAPPEVQDEAVLRNARLSKGGFWSQHPGCSEKYNLPKFPF